MRFSWLITRFAASESDSTKLMAPTRSAYSPAHESVTVDACALKESRAAARQAFYMSRSCVLVRAKSMLTL